MVYLEKQLGADINSVMDRMFLADPLLFRVSCLFQRKINNKMHCIVRVWKDEIQINEAVFPEITNRLLYEEMACTLIRIVLNHTSARKPEGVKANILTRASDMVMNGFYPFREKQLTPLHHFPQGKDLAFYAIRLQAEANMKKDKPQQNDNQDGDNDEDKEKQQSPGGGGGGSSDNDEDENNQNGNKSRGGSSGGSENDEQQQDQGQGDDGDGDSDEGPVSQQTKSGRDDEASLWDQSSGWEENAFKSEQVKREVQQAILSGQGCGNLTGTAKEALKANLEPKVDYREMLRGYQASITASNRILTRMKPNRRTGFTQMGSRREMKSRLLVAIDTSGSVASLSLAGFFSVINHMFRFGIETIDVVQFDHGIQTEITSIQKANPEVSVVGRGGTDFQCVVDMVAKSKQTYDGLLFFTDGYAPVPKIPAGFKPKIFWLMDSEESWKSNRKELGTVGRTAWMDVDTEVARLSLN
ncbi:MAG: VWA-like domain-containing protein [Paludibacteraceae bacterium]|nr:VWA-like domain-containing protein [Paludibacteraceae bacterium]